MTLNKTLSIIFMLGILSPFHALAQEAVAELNPDDVLARIHFDPATYELYRPWAEEWFEELGKPLAPHKLPEVEGDELLHRMTGRLPVDWVRAVLSTEAVRSEDGKEYVMTVLLPVMEQHSRDVYSSVVERLIIQAFYDNRGFAQEAFQAKQKEVEQRGGEFEKSANEVGDQIHAGLQELERDRREISDEMLQSQIAAIEEGPKLELDMNLAEMDARRERILQKLAESQQEVATEAELSRKRQEIHEEVSTAIVELDALTQHLQTHVDPAGSEKVDAASKRVEELKRAAATIERENARVTSSAALHGQLNQLLTEAEINVAGLEAKRDVLLQQYDGLKDRLARRIDIQEKIDELTTRQSQLQSQAQEVYGSLDADDFRTPRPVIEWIPEPEKVAE